MRVTPGCRRGRRPSLTEVEERISDLLTIRDNLRAALDAGCADLIACAGTDCCPIPFETITTRPGISGPAREMS